MTNECARRRARHPQRTCVRDQRTCLMENSSDPGEPSSPTAGVEWMFDLGEEEDLALAEDEGEGDLDPPAWVSEAIHVHGQPWRPPVPSTLGPQISESWAGHGGGSAPQAAAPNLAAEAASRAAPPIRSADEPVERPNAKKKRRNYVRDALSADQVEALMDQDLKSRPLVLDTAATAQAGCGGWVFKEVGKAIRPADPRADKWRRGGGAGGATDLPSSQEPRVRRRYGYVISAANQLPRLRYHQYCRLLPTQAEGKQSSGGTMNVVEDTQTWLYHVLPVASPLAPAATRAHSSDHRAPTTQVLGTLHVEAQVEHVETGRRDPLLRLSAAPGVAGQTTEFVRFEEAGREHGGICHSDHGLQLRSAAGDFAEWHPAVDTGELPYAEGSVVGLFGGKISLRTEDADMVAVVSRRALCVGSFPGPDKALEGDVIAYLGQVPVRVRGRVASGDKLVPSMRHDGTAIVYQGDTNRGTNLGRHNDAAVIGIAMSAHTPADVGVGESSDGNCADIGMVDTFITPPSAQKLGPTKKQLPQETMDPALAFVAFRQQSAHRHGKILMRACAAAVAVVTGLVLALVHTSPVDSSWCHGKDCGTGWVHPGAPSAHNDPCDDADCAPGNCTVVGKSSTAAGTSHRRIDASVPTDGLAEVRCDCPNGYSFKTMVGDNGTTSVLCEPNVCTHMRSSLVDPVTSNTIQWARLLEYAGVHVANCGSVRSFERCEYRCDPGYQPTGDALCLPNGTITGGGCTPLPCAPLAIPHSDHAHGNECTGFAGDECNFTCAKGYRRADQALAIVGMNPPTATSPLLCGPAVNDTQGFVSNFAFAISGMRDAVYNGVYTMINKTCRGQPVWQQQQRYFHGGAIIDGPVLYSRVRPAGWELQGSLTSWFIGPAARTADCSDLNDRVHATMQQNTCTDITKRKPMHRGDPDNVACNPPASIWMEIVPDCEGLAPDCHCADDNSGICFYYNSKLRVERTVVGTDGQQQQQQLCVLAH